MEPRTRLATVPQAGRVVAFPPFERYGDRIHQWLDALEGKDDPAPRTTAALIRSMREMLVEVDRVRGSQRHYNLAGFVRHASTALQNAEFDGARYILTAALALAEAKVRYAGAAGTNVCQFPAGAVKLPADVTTGIALG